MDCKNTNIHTTINLAQKQKLEPEQKTPALTSQTHKKDRIIKYMRKLKY